MPIVRTVSDLIGDNPLFFLSTRGLSLNVFLKLEKFNPGGSMKDRMARGMIDDACRSKGLRPGGTVIESTSGNTGVGLAMLAAERGYGFIAVVDHHAAKDKVLAMKAYGAEIHFVGGGRAEDEVAVDERERYAKKLSEEMPGSIFLAQADNPANSESYSDTLGPEIYSQLNGAVDYVVGAVGTGGSLSGTARYLRKGNESLSVLGVEPFGSVIFGPPDLPYYQSGTGNPGSVSVGKNVDYSSISSGFKVTDKEAFNTARHFARRLGLLVGGSSGGVIFAALKYAFENVSSTRGNMVVIVPDGGEKYLDTIFNEEWMKERGLIDQSVSDFLQSVIVTDHAHGK